MTAKRLVAAVLTTLWLGCAPTEDEAVSDPSNDSSAVETAESELSSSLAKCVTQVRWKVNGKSVAKLHGSVKQGDTVEVEFKVPAKCPAREMTLVSYTAPEAKFTNANAHQQKIHQADSGTFGPGVHTLKVQVPPCYFQVDFVFGPAIAQFDPKKGVTYSAQERLICATNGGTNACQTCQPLSQHESITTTPADVLFVVDRSASMSTRMSGSTTQWSALTQAFGAVLPGLDGRLNMGLFTYPAGQQDICGVKTFFDVPIGGGNSGIISATLNVLSPAGNTPTSQALSVVETTLASLPSPLRRFIVLATDGVPNCEVNAVTNSVARVMALQLAGVDTFVLGISSASNPALQQLAVAGGRPRSGPTAYYTAQDAAELQTALNEIVTIASCSFKLMRAPREPDKVVVKLNGAPVTAGSADGWRYTDTTFSEILLEGASCATLKSGLAHTLDIELGCVGGL